MVRVGASAEDRGMLRATVYEERSGQARSVQCSGRMSLAIWAVHLLERLPPDEHIVFKC